MSIINAYLKNQSGDYIYPESPIRMYTVSGASINMTIQPNRLYKFGSLTSLTLALGSIDSNYAPDYYIKFTSDNVTVSWPSGITWENNTAPTINNGKTYEVSFLDGVGMCKELY